MKFDKHFQDHYPFLYRGDDCLLNFVPTGWHEAIVGAAAEITQCLEEAGLNNQFIWTADMIEREGHLRWYWGETARGLPEEVAERIKQIVAEVEDKTLDLCVHCGAPATHTLKVMYYPLCTKCAKQTKYYNLVKELNKSPLSI